MRYLTFLFLLCIALASGKEGLKLASEKVPEAQTAQSCSTERSEKLSVVEEDSVLPDSVAVAIYVR